MLYDVVPPLLFVGSLSGIIFIIARVVTRLRRHALSAALQSAAASKTPSSPSHLRPAAAHIRLFGSRLSLLKPLLNTISIQVKAAGMFIRAAASALPNRLSKFRRAKTIPTTLPAISPPPPAPLRPASAPAVPLAPQPHIIKKVVSPAFFQKKSRPSPLEVALTALERGETTKVEEILVPYLFKHPTAAPAYVLLGKAAMQQGNWSDAVEIFEQAVAQDEPPREAQALLGISAYHAGHLVRALPALQRAHDQDSKNREVLKYLLKIARTMDNRALLHSLEVEKAALETPAQS